MANNQDDSRHQYSSTYFVDRSNQEEWARLAVQDQMITEGMGGPLPEQPATLELKRVLDVSCGPGGWLIQIAKRYPDIPQLIGIDVNADLLNYAREQARIEGVSDRVEFHVMDALLILEFPKQYFDLVNARFITSYMRTWNWAKLIDEMRRITRIGGTIRLTEIEQVHTNIPAPIRLTETLSDALYNAGHLFSPGKTEGLYSQGTLGVARDLSRLLAQYGVENIQTRSSHLEFPHGTPQGHHFAEDLRLGFRTFVPFMRKWSRVPENYDQLYEEMLTGIEQPDFTGAWDLLTAWGTPIGRRD